MIHTHMLWSHSFLEIALFLYNTDIEAPPPQRSCDEGDGECSCPHTAHQHVVKAFQHIWLAVDEALLLVAAGRAVVARAVLEH